MWNLKTSNQVLQNAKHLKKRNQMLSKPLKSNKSYSHQNKTSGKHLMTFYVELIQIGTNS